LENALFEDRAKYKYLIFQLGEETYGTPLLSVREVIENKPAKAVPNSHAAFEGVINLRGDVIGVVDLRKLLRIPPRQSLSILVFESELGTLGGIVDRCLSVTEIPDQQVDKKGGLNHGEGRDYFLGIGKLPDGLVTLIDLVQVTRTLATKTSAPQG
jgi:purine-binding chemotaxis protein CheW